ncbi:DUF4344 domain-containing metallopeptidase [Streptomyces sp. NBC_01565]|uniref:DUF4344 domain-containing metallopeptidase n=1 Tax=Streptomyces sp. NBC_01565 TaxID=2975881 RepID=UPI00224C8622|nr:DUF4344 domain-containing metallopeptidase [Streptomyces sp. NBC_01565]MCX4541652.1 DUF4344 domain-containing metallopeptidase [Streptomyces sp. NBC_01565]
MSRRRGTLALCAAALCAAALLPVTGCERQPPARGFTVAYEEPAAADRGSARALRERRVVESAATELNGYLDLPYEVTLLGRSCAGEGSGYDPGARLIELCYEDLTEQRELFETAGRRPAEEEAAAVMTETVFHEAGHALADALDLRFDADRAEEDAADAFAALMLIREGPPGERTLLTAARAYELAAAHPDPDPDPDPGPDEHAPPAARAAAHLCRLHAASPARHPAAPTAQPCPDTWTRALTPLLRRPHRGSA